MDFNRNNIQTPGSRPVQPVGNPVQANTSKQQKPSKNVNLMKIGAFALLLCLVIIIGALALLFNFGDSRESKAIASTKLQTVFLNNGQVYFGNIKTLNDKYLDLTGIYYLRTNSTSTAATPTTTTSGDVSLVKLGCELHGPYDEMIINRAQVTFLENLKDTGQVAKAIAQYKKQNPGPQKCTTSTTGTQQSPSATVPSNTSGSTTAAPTPAATTKTTP
jgi:hypothetical protein